MTNLGTLAGLGLVLAAAACSSDKTTTTPGGTGGSAPGTGGSNTNATAGTAPTTAGNSGIPGTGGSNPGTGGSGNATAGSGPSTGGSNPGTGGTPPVSTGGSGPGTGGSGPGTGGSGPVVPELAPLVTSASGAYWKTGTLADSTATATVTVNDSSAAQKWEGMGAAFNELGWKYLSTADMQNKAIGLLFSASDGANFAWGRIPIGASDYAEIRYTPEDIQGADPAPDGTESNRPAADTSLAKFSLDRDKTKLIPYIKAAQAVKKDLRFWASPWTPPIWMKTGYKKNSGASPTPSPNVPTKPSYYDGGNMKSDTTILAAYAQYFVKFVQGYKDQGINIEIVSPQNEPGYDQNYPSCLWDKTTYTTFIGKHLGPAMQPLGIKIMLGTLSNESAGKDADNAAAALADATAKSFLSVIGAQWGMLDTSKLSPLGNSLPIWASEHKCGNYPWESTYNKTQAPNDQAYGVESWGYIRDAIKNVKVTSYSAWNMVLDKTGLGNDTSRDWRQDALLVADGGQVTATPAYYVFRHISQYAQPGATVVGTTGGDAVAFKNPDGSLVAVMFNSGAANSSYVIAIGGKKYSFAMPANGWATVKVKP